MMDGRRLDAVRYVGEAAEVYASDHYKFRDDDLLALPPADRADLAEVIVYWLASDAADHPFSFVQDMRARVLRGQSLTLPGLRGVANCMLRLWEQRLNGHAAAPSLRDPGIPF